MYILLTLLGDPVLGLLWLCVGCIAKNSWWGTSDRPTWRPASAVGQHPGGRPPISPVFFSHCHYAHQHWNYFTNITTHWVAVWEELSENESSYRLQHTLHSTSPNRYRGQCLTDPLKSTKERENCCDAIFIAGNKHKWKTGPWNKSFGDLRVTYVSHFSNC